jgi:putative membrane protein
MENEMAGETRTELADARTDLAEDRTLLANERTFAGWARTAFAAVGIGLGFNALFEKLEPDWLPKAISTAFLLIGVFVITVAERRASAVRDRLDSHQVKTFKAVNLRIITGAIVLATATLIVAIWMLI